MIVNLCGPPCGGKSTFAARFVLEHPQFKYCPIDEYRIEYEGDETRAWHELTKDVLNKRHCIIESCGMGWRLSELLKLPKLRRRHLLSIAFMGDRGVLRERLRERQKRGLPFPFIPSDEVLALDYAIEHFSRMVTNKVDHTVVTTWQDKDQVYDYVNQLIQSELLSTKGQRIFRTEEFPSKKFPPTRRSQKARAFEL